MLLIAIYNDKDGMTKVGEIEQGRYIETDALKPIFSSTSQAEVDKFMSTNKKNYKRDSNLTSIDPNVLSIWTPGPVA